MADCTAVCPGDRPAAPESEGCLGSIGSPVQSLPSSFSSSSLLPRRTTSSHRTNGGDCLTPGPSPLAGRVPSSGSGQLSVASGSRGNTPGRQGGAQPHLPHFFVGRGQETSTEPDEVVAFTVTSGGSGVS